MSNKCKIFKEGKKQSGITLVALVVTIVVLLVLAGVSIRLVLDNNGIIVRAGDARDRHEQAKANDETDLNNVSSWIDENVSGKEYEGLTVTSSTQGVVFTKSDGTTAGDINNIETGDIVKYGDYEYHYNQRFYYDRYSSEWKDDTTIGGWGVQIIDRTKTDYGELCGTIFDKKVKCLNWLFGGLGSRPNENIVRSPRIPNSVESMADTFHGCSKLTNIDKIPSSVQHMDYAFWGCNLNGTIIIDANPISYNNWVGWSGEGNITITGSSSMLNELAERIW